MKSFGEQLKKERENRKKSLADIAKATKISKIVLAAIEEEQYESLPPLSYIKGFLRIYAGELDLDPDEIVEGYIKELKEKRWEPQKELKEPVPQRINKKYIYIAAGIALIVFYFVYRSIRPETENTQLNTVPKTALPLASVAVKEAAQPASEPVKETDLSIAPVFVEDGARPARPARPAREAVEKPQAQAAFAEDEKTAEPRVSQSSQMPSLDAQAPKEQFTVRFVAREMNWIKITVDDKDPFEIMLREGETYSHKAVDCMKLRIGNAGGLALFFNDIPLGVAGEPGRAVNLQFPEAAERL